MQELLDLPILAIATNVLPRDRAACAWNSKVVTKRLQPEDVKQEKIAVVGYGPSLKQTWEMLREYSIIMTTSGAHNFLLERGLVPKYHVEVDPREHKAVFTEQPNKDVKYLICSTAHPSIVQNLKDFDTCLWHFDSMGQEEASLETYGDVGQQAIYIAKYLGYKDIHLFGFDYSYDASGMQHAAVHGREYKEGVGKVKGTKHYSHWELIKNLKFFDILMQENPDLELTIIGDGLLSHYLEAKYVVSEVKYSTSGDVQ